MAQFRTTRSLRKDKQQQKNAQAGARKKSYQRLIHGGIALAAAAAVLVGSWAALGPVRLSSVQDAAQLVGRRGKGFPLESGSGSMLQAGLAGNNLVLLWPTVLDIYTSTAYQSASEKQTYTKPAMHCAGNRVVMFDHESGHLALLSKTKILYERELPQAIFCVGLNRRGDLAAASGAEGAACEITAWDTSAWDADEKPRFSWRCEKEYPAALQPSKNGKGLGLCLIGTEQAAVYSRFVEFVYSKQDPVTDLRLKDVWLYGAAQRSGCWFAVGDQAAYRIKKGGETPDAAYSYEGRSLRAFDLDESGYCAVLLNDWDNRALLRIYGRSGKLEAEHSFAQRPSQLICRGGSVYVRFDNTLLRWQKSTEFRQSQPLAQGVQNVLVAGRSAYVITVSSVERVQPSWSAPNEAWF